MPDVPMIDLNAEAKPLYFESKRARNEYAKRKGYDFW